MADRYERLIALQNRISWEENQKQEGRTVEVLVAAGEGRKDGETRRMSGRARDNRLVHFAVPNDVSVRPGDMVTVDVTYGAPHHLLADSALQEGGQFALRRTRAGDLWEAAQENPSDANRIALGTPTIRVGA